MLHLYGLTPALGSYNLLFVVCFFIVFQQSFLIANTNISGGMIADIADEMLLESGKRQEGILNSGMMLAQQMTFGLGAFFAGIAIEFTGFDGVTDPAMVADTMTGRLAWSYGPGLMCLIFVVAYIYSRYPLSKSRSVEIRKQLAELRA
ncbi:MAG: MFS transporter [Halioglobus sp.]